MLHMERVRSSITDEQRYEAVANAWLAGQISTNTRAAYRIDLARFGHWCADHSAVPLRVGAADVVAFQAACAGAGESPSTIRRRSSSLSSFFQYALDHDAVSRNPVTGSNRPPIEIDDPSPTRVLTAEHVESSLAWAAKHDGRLHALLALLVFDGLKMGEALAVDVDDLSGRPPRVQLAIPRRTGRPVVLHERSHGAVRHLAGRRRGQPLFVSARLSEEDGAPRRLTRFGADHLIKRLPTAERNRPLTANELRRFHISAAHRAGVDLDEIGDRAGLDDVRSVRRYLVPPQARPGRSRRSSFATADRGSDRPVTPSNNTNKED